jgi:hypothetical protein
MPKSPKSTPEPSIPAATLTDPRERFPKPPFHRQQQPPPGSSRPLKPPADFGENTYTGRGRLQGRAALTTGTDSAIGRAVSLCFAKDGADFLFAHLKEERRR